MGIGTIAEPLVVVTLLFGGTWVNRNKDYKLFGRRRDHTSTPRSTSPDSESGRSSLSSSASLLAGIDEVPKWRTRELRFFGFKTEVTSPNSRRFKDYFLSRLLIKFPFLVEAWYWALIYWVYQLGRAFSAVTMLEGTVNVARRHALQLIHLEQRLHIFWELDVQHWFLQHPLLLHWTNRIYSFIHIPGTILFLVFLFLYTTMQNRVDLPSYHQRTHTSISPSRNASQSSLAGPFLYEARRRTMATCNLIAFIVFTLWPCMPPRLLSDPKVPGAVGEEARSFGFVDTVHSAKGESSVWTQNKFCNQYAAMPSLHFGYSLLIGLTVLTLPLAPHHERCTTISLRTPFAGKTIRLRVPSARRLACLIVGVAYPTIILIAIVATANHFVLDAVAGAMVCGLAWTGNRVLLNLLPLEDYFLWCVKIDKPERMTVLSEDGENDERVLEKSFLGQ